MANRIKLKRGPSSHIAAADLQQGELAITTDTNKLYTVDSSGNKIILNENASYNLESFGVTATSTELNYVDGVTSNIQTQLNNKADASHGTHVTWAIDTPKAAGTAAVGSEATVARGDHVHPAQTSVSGSSGSCTGNAATATKWATARTLTIGKTGKSVNGTSNVSWSLDEIGSNVYVGTSAPTDADVDVWVDPSGSIDLSQLWNSIYPVGSIYMSVSSTNPGTLFPGTTWTALQDRFLVGAGNSYAVNATGGHKDLQSHTHSIPALSGTAAASTHTHVVTTKTTTYAQGSQSSWRCLSWPGTNADYSQTVHTNNGSADGSHTHSVSTNASTSGSTGAGNGGNMPPYLAVYMWKRTA